MLTREHTMVRKLLDFLEVDSETTASASILSELLIPRIDDVIEKFYDRVRNFAISRHVTDQAVAVLKDKHKKHWVALFRSQFQEEYFASIRRIGMRHRDIELSPMWYVAGYMWLKRAFIEVIMGSDFPVATKGRLVMTLDKYIAIDMALALSTYDAVILD